MCVCNVTGPGAPSKKKEKRYGIPPTASDIFMDLEELLDLEIAKLPKAYLAKLVEFIIVNESLDNESMNWPIPLNDVTEGQRPNVKSFISALEEEGIIVGKRKKKFSSLQNFMNFKAYMLTKFAIKTLLVKQLDEESGEPEMVVISCDGNSHGGGGKNSNFALTVMLKFHNNWHLIGGILYSKEASAESCTEIREKVESCSNQLVELSKSRGWHNISCLLVFESNSGEHFVTELLSVCITILQDEFKTATPHCSKHPRRQTVKMQKGTLNKYFSSVSSESISIQPKPMLIISDAQEGSILFNKAVEEMLHWNVYKKALMCSDDVADCIGMGIYYSDQQSNICEASRFILRKRSRQCDFDVNEATRMLLHLALIAEDEESKELISSLARMIEKCSCHP